MLSLADHVLRYWEKEFVQLRPRKTNQRNKRYVQNDIDTLKKIQYLLHGEKYTIEGAKMRLPMMLDISLARYKNLTSLVLEPTFWKEIEDISKLL